MTAAAIRRVPSLRPALAAVVAGVDWWIGVLAGMLPRRLAGRAQDATFLDVAPDGATLLQIQPGGARRIVADRAPHGATLPATLRLPTDLVLTRTVTLASAAEENLHEVVGFQLDRFTPFELDEVYLGCRVIARDPDAEASTVVLAVAQRDAVDALTQAAARHGFDCIAVVTSIDPLETGAAIDLPLDTKSSLSAAPASGRGTRVLVALAGVLAAACIALPLLRGHERIAQLQAELAGLRRDATAVATLRDTVEQRAEQTAIPLQRWQRTPLSVLLAELTRIVPDDGWVTQLEIDPGAIQLTGFAVAANGLIPALEASPLLTNASFRSPVTQDAIRGVEQFHISVDLRKRNE